MIRRWFLRALLPVLILASVLYFCMVSAGTSEALVIEDDAGSVMRIVYPGQMDFIPARLVPNRVQVHHFPLHSRYLLHRQLYLLPQHELLGLDQSFAVQIALNYRYSIDPAALSALFLRLDRAEPEAVSEFLKLRLADFWYGAFRYKLQADRDLDGLLERSEDYIRGDLLAELNGQLAADGLRIDAVYIEDIVVPDPARYRAVVANGQRIVDERLVRLRAIEDARTRRSVEEILLSGKRRHLEELGALLGKYPDLREYIAIDGIKDHVQVFVMPYERFTGKGPVPSLPPENQVDSNSSLHRFGIRSDLPELDNGFRDLSPE